MDHVLIIRFSSLGDIILATSVIDAVRGLWPECEITFVAKREYAPVLDQNAQLDRVIALRPSERGIVSLWRLGRRLRRGGVDLVLDLHGGARGRVLSWAVGCRRTSRVDSRRRARMLMVLSPLRWRRDLPHAVERYMECLSTWSGGDETTRGPWVWLTDIERSTARAELSDWEGAQVVAVAPGARWRSKRWPERLFADLAGSLAAEGTRVVVMGSKEEGPIVRRIVEAGDYGGLVTGFTGGLRQLAAMFSACTASVCNDSGLMHLSAAVGTPTLGIFGPTAPHFGFTPYGRGHGTIWLGFECSPCSRHGDKPCRIAERAPCMENIEVSRVLSTLRPLMAEARSGRRSELGQRRRDA
jgi:lipopolysaccharide heptosyltransferase II